MYIETGLISQHVCTNFRVTVEHNLVSAYWSEDMIHNVIPLFALSCSQKQILNDIISILTLQRQLCAGSETCGSAQVSHADSVEFSSRIFMVPVSHVNLSEF